MADDVKGAVLPPDAPPTWWPTAWPWPPPTSADDVGQLEAWAAKIDRDYESFSDRGDERAWGQRRRELQIDDERHDTQANNADRQSARDVRTAQLQDQLNAQRAQFEGALWSSYLNRHDNLHAMTLQIISDGLQHSREVRADSLADFRMNRGVAYDRTAEKAMNTQLVETVKDAVSMALKELLGPSRGGAAPSPSYPYTPSQPVPPASGQ